MFASVRRGRLLPVLGLFAGCILEPDPNFSASASTTGVATAWPGPATGSILTTSGSSAGAMTSGGSQSGTVTGTTAAMETTGGHEATSTASATSATTATSTSTGTSSSTGGAQQTPEALVRYAFDEGEGAVVYDVSNRAPYINLAGANPDALVWGDGSLTFATETVLVSSSPTSALVDSVLASQAITVELWFTAANLTQSGPARIFAAGETGTGEANFMIGQDETSLRIRFRTSETGESGFPDAIVYAVVSTDTPVHLVYTWSAGQESVLVDGTLVWAGTRSGTLDTWTELPLSIANLPSLDRPWLGTMHCAAIYDAVLDAEIVAAHQLAGPC